MPERPRLIASPARSSAPVEATRAMPRGGRIQMKPSTAKKTCTSSRWRRLRESSSALAILRIPCLSKSTPSRPMRQQTIRAQTPAGKLQEKGTASCLHGEKAHARGGHFCINAWK
eukprot:scaffold1982_cov278-Pinguiococcus_pyrenoidosus.AAC.1